VQTDALSYHVFMSNAHTRKECLTRMLFGSPSDSSKVRAGSLLFLFNYSDNTLSGPFEAASDSQFNLDKAAWGGRYP
jgi:hypothetical protein